jgi:hypothetical protein
MSHRALRRLRQEREPQILGSAAEQDDEESDDDGKFGLPKPTANAFAMVDDDDDDDYGSVGSPSDDDESEEVGYDAEEPKVPPPLVTFAPSTNVQDAKQEEDLDALLEEYKLQDKTLREEIPTITKCENASWYSIITSRMDPRDLDIDYVMRTSLLGCAENGTATSRSSRRANRQIPTFGPPRDNWPRPPHYVGGGMGMTSYADEYFGHHHRIELSTSRQLPWPYIDMKEGDERCPPISHWFKFTVSDSYKRDLQDFETIKASGDANALAMFIAHHPFVVEALLQLSLVLYQTSQPHDGLSLLKRVLWVFECAALNSFLRLDGTDAQMDVDLPENKPFFDALFRLIRVSYVGGLARTSLAVSRFLLSLDPLRDPMNVLLAMDHFALSCNRDICNEWLVDFVESKKVSKMMMSRSLRPFIPLSFLFSMQ